MVNDISGRGHLKLYNHLSHRTTDPSQRLEYVIVRENLRKLISKDGSAAYLGDAQKISDGLMYSVLDRKQKIKPNKIMGDHGLYALYDTMNNIQYV